MPTVIQVHNLSKRYRIGRQEKRHDTFAGQLISTLKAPIRNFRQLRSLSRFAGEDDSVFWALKDINFEVQQGEVLGIIGHNGAGKSTLLKILSRITEPTSGEIRVKGRVSALLEVGTGFHPELTGRENVYMNGTILGMTKREIDTKFDEIVDFSGVEKYIDTPVKFYSSGMKVRLGFAVAAHLEPEILIIDEVLAVGDAEFQRKCLGKMESVSKEGRTVIFVSHDMGAMSSLTERCILLNLGKISLDYNTDFVIKEYLGKTTSESIKINSNILSNLQVRVRQQGNRFSSGVVSFGSDVEFIINFTSGILSENIYLFLRIEDERGEVITTVNSVDNNFSFNMIEGKPYSFCFGVKKLNLLPGTYFFTFALQNKFKEVLDVYSRISSFEITKENTPDRLKKLNNKTGKVYFFGEWKN